MNYCQKCLNPYEPTRSNQKYCSRTCFYESIRGHKSYIPLRRFNKVCPVCHKEFQTGGRVGKSHKVYCSLRCSQRSGYKLEPTCNNLSSLEASYIAGFIDGEGSIFLHKHRSAVVLRLTGTNTYKEVIEWLQNKTGVGNIITKIPREIYKNKHKVCYNWNCNNESAESVLRQILPYLIVKKRQALLALNLIDEMRSSGNRLDSNYLLERYEEMKLLNKRGPG